MPTDPNVADIQIKINGAIIRPEIMRDLRLAEVDQSLQLPSAATLEFFDPELQHIDNESLFKVGNDVEIAAASNSGFEELGQADTIFRGVITTIEPVFDSLTNYNRLSVRAYDRLHNLHRGAKSKTYQNKTDSDIVKAIATDAGLSARVDDTRVQHEHVFRPDCTDFEFLQMLAQRNGYVVTIDEKQIRFCQPSSLQRGEVELKFGEGLREFRPTLSTVGQVDRVEIGGWDREQKKEVVGRASTPRFTETKTTMAPGFRLAVTAFNERTLHRSYVAKNQAVADAEAKGLLDRIAAADFQAEGVAYGNPKIAAGTLLKISRLGRRFSGQYYVTRVRHRLEPEVAFTTEFWVGGLSSGTVASLVSNKSISNGPPVEPLIGLYPAIVSNIKDEQQTARIKVKFPHISEMAESTWAPVLGIGAGNDRGLMILPEVGDEVLVAFMHGDPNYPVVLGGLWSKREKIEQGLANDRGVVDVRTWKTRSGHVLRFTDKSGAEKIELLDKTGKNSFVIDTANNSITILATKDITLEAKGNVSIKGTNVKLESTASFSAKGQVLSAEAQTNITLKGNAGAELSSPGVTKISGSMVNIN